MENEPLETPAPPELSEEAKAFRDKRIADLTAQANAETLAENARLEQAAKDDHLRQIQDEVGISDLFRRVALLEQAHFGKTNEPIVKE